MPGVMDTPDPVHHAFPMVADARTRLLMLGSLPGRASLAASRYYAHPQNQFWSLMSRVVGCDLLPLAYEERLDALRRARVGLWDMIASARRRGSLDGAIRDAEPRDLVGAIADLPDLRAIAFNGATAYRLGVRQLGPAPRLPLILLPSSSPAHAVGLASKQQRWDALAAYLSEPPSLPNSESYLTAASAAEDVRIQEIQIRPLETPGFREV
jgi:hypoxanthine-DNA glycosylase